MKKWICILLVLCLAGCAKAEPAATTAADASVVDVDLTGLSNTMLYSEVFHMTVEPDAYIGNRVKVIGQFSVYEDPGSGKRYFAVVVSDATACCAQGLEFQLAGEPTYPDDYPAVGSVITVTGTFGTYLEGNNRYCELTDATLNT